jgi:hypothetical protein
MMPAKITELWAWLSEAEGEGVLASEMEIGGRVMLVPLVGADRERIESYRPHALAIARLSGQAIKLMRFAAGEVIERHAPEAAAEAPAGDAMSEREAELVEAFNRGRCPDCHGAKTIAGPRGGLSQNVTCGDCGQRFNVASWQGRVVHVDRLGTADRPAGGPPENCLNPKASAAGWIVAFCGCALCVARRAKK